MFMAGILHYTQDDNITMKYILIIILLFGLIIPNQAFAQTITTQEFGVSPFLEELEIPKGGTAVSSINVTNQSNSDINVSVTTQDFLPGKRGEAMFVPDSEINEKTFSLASWINILDGSSVVIPAGKSAEIKYSVNPPTNAEEGSHYGAILFSLADQSNLPGVGIRQSVGTIIIVGYGQAQPIGTLDFSSNPKILWWSDKFDFTNLFSNVGNVHVKPKGEIVVKNIFGKVVATPQVNRDADNVLPKSDRTFISSWYPENWRFGRYRAESILVYGREKLEVRQSQIIWVLPVYTLSIIGAVAIFLLWFFLHGRHWHRRRVVRRHLEKNSI